MLTCLQLRRFDLVISHIIFSSEVWQKKTSWKICYFVQASAQEGCTGAVCRETHLPRRLKGANRRPPRRRRAAARSEGDGGAGKPSEHRFACTPSVGGLAGTSKARPAQVSSLAEAHPLVRLPAVSLPPRTSRASRKHIRPHRPSPRKRARADYPCESASSHTQKGSPRSHERRRRAHASIPTKARPLEQRDASCPRARREPTSLGSPITSSGRTACTGADAPTRTSLPTCTGSRACGRSRSAGAARGCGGRRRRSPWPGTAPRWSRSRSSS